MTEERLERLNLLNAEIKKLEKLYENNEKQKCEFIYFSFGNGSSREVVCNDSKIIEKVRDLIRIESEIKLDSLISEFNND